MTAKQVTFTNQVSLPAIGQGTWYMGEDPSRRRDEVSALQAGLDLGLRLIDTAEMYADGAAEEVVGEALTGRRDSAFLASRGIEYDLLPWCQQQQMPVMAYSPLAQAGRLRGDLLSNSVVNDIARVHNVSAAQILLAWVIRQSGVIAIPKAASVAHVEQNAAALQITLSVDELKQLDKAYPAPKGKTALDMA
ncbi:aldo/keto reductase [Citrobacter freundii]|uniref:aldo/keto reductase n=1 Tax=Citrobacter freundii TaxID=546 RepID=UPI0033385A17